MSSNERAPEPTMEEIISSIRRIIADDETGAQPSAAPAAKSAAHAVEEPEGDADTKIIDDIARVLSGAGPSPGAAAARPAGEAPAAAVPPDEDDDVLDLMDLGEAIPGTLDVVEYEVSETVVQTGSAEGPDFSSAFPPDSESVFKAEEPEPEPSPEPSPPVEPMEAPVESKPWDYEPPAAPGRREQSLEDPTAAFERALAALKAGDLNAFAREVETPSAPAPSPASRRAFEFETPAEAAAEAAPAEQPAPESASPAAETSAATSPSSWRSRIGLSEFQPRTQRGNGGSGHKLHALETAAGAKTLEDSVKEMLRPMLQKWLDENMSRVLTQALREELEKSPQARRGE
jgi:cell pole-organizing protein PopZ